MIESNRVEFKKELNDSLEKEVVGFLNYSEGGEIYSLGKLLSPRTYLTFKQLKIYYEDK